MKRRASQPLPPPRRSMNETVDLEFQAIALKAGYQYRTKTPPPQRRLKGGKESIPRNPHVQPCDPDQP